MSAEPGDSEVRSTATNSGVFRTLNAAAVSEKTVTVWSSYTYAALVVLRTFHEPRWNARTLVRVAPVLNVRPALSIFTSEPLVGSPCEFRKFFGTWFVKLDVSWS